MYDVNPLDDMIIPLFSLEFLTQPSKADENVRTLAVVFPQAGTIHVDVKQESTTQVLSEPHQLKMELTKSKWKMVNDAR